MSKRGASPSVATEVKRARTIYTIDTLYEKITVDPADKKLSKKLVDETLADIIGHIRNEQRNGKLYDHRIVKAGSHAINAKIGQADEFDTNIRLNVEDYATCRTSGGINYRHIDNENSDKNMTQSLQLVRTHSEIAIPSGYAVVEVKDNQNIDFKMFKKFPTYGVNWMLTQINVNRSRGNTELIPRDIKRDFHAKIRTAIHALHLHNVKLDDNAHGPALTMTLSRGEEVPHKIDVDLTLSLKIALEFEKFGWPRIATRRAFSKEQIKQVLDAGIHLVPKKNLFWAISFSRGERALLSNIDADNACRKMTLKILKYLMEECKSKSSSNLHGMSSHILKTQVLWSCEIHADERNYWNRGNRDACLVNTMKELISSLLKGSLLDYFNSETNVLKGKDAFVLNELVSFMSNVLSELK